MAKFRKKAVVIEATQWFKNGDHPLDGIDPLAGDELGGPEGKVVKYFHRTDENPERRCEKCGRTMRDHGWIDTLEGGHIVCPCDWIITSVQGERYPCKPDIFELTYEEVELIEPESFGGAVNGTWDGEQ